MSKLRRRFTTTERLEIVKQSFEPDSSVTQTARQYQISANTLSRWRADFGREHDIKPEGQGIKVLTDEERRIAQLEKQLRQTQLERDILKKAIGIFSQNDQKSTLL